jgi:hypothetical protein
LIRQLAFEIARGGPGIERARAAGVEMDLCLRPGADDERQDGEMSQFFHHNEWSVIVASSLAHVLFK